jgi:NADH dehydrogenase FAD-containing subunit
MKSLADAVYLRNRLIEHLEEADFECSTIPPEQLLTFVVAGGGFAPPTAQHALRQGQTLGSNIVATVKGGTKKAFAFSTLGQLAAIGKRTGVAKILGFKFSGFIAWWLWRTIYLSKLPRLEKKLRVTLDWTLDLVFSKDLVQFMPLRSPGITKKDLTTATLKTATEAGEVSLH